MIYQIPEFLRLFIIFVPQIFMVGLFTFIIFKILKRNTNRNSLTLSGFYFTVSIGLAMNGIAVLIAFFSPGEFVAVLYFFLTYLTVFSFVFVIVFILGLLKLKYVFTVKHSLLIIFAYGTVWLILLLFPGGITYSENWAPEYSSELYIAANILFTITFTIPVIYYSIRLRKLFKDSNLKKKLSLFLIGIMLAIIIIYGTMLYNTWKDDTFKTVWGLSTIVLLISSGLLIYYGIGRDL
ncbi:MAG: hypothetical protein KGD67_03885 [Candidatus Lokiarchaeota archaeon]|nr:hypothetical protein [Candidatus Lokiarchaeota archaeon]